MFNINKLTAENQEKMKSLLRAAGSNDKTERETNMAAIAAAIQEPIRQGILVGDIVGNIFNKFTYDPNSIPTYPIDLYRPDNAGEFRAFTIPNQGKIPERHVESDYLTIPTYSVGAAIDFLTQYAREARWDVVGRALEVLAAGFVKKINDDGFHALLAGGFDRNIIVSDTNAVAGQFTKRLVSLMKLVMRRNGGGNSASINRTKLTHLFVSPEAMEDVRNWGLDQVDDFTRREIFTSEEDGFSSIYGTTIVDLDEFGEGQEYQDYYTNVTAAGASNGGLASATDLEICIGLDAAHNDSFLMPIRHELTIESDVTLARQLRTGFFSTMQYGVAVLNSSRLILASF